MPAARAEVQVAPASVLNHMSPALPMPPPGQVAAPSPNTGGRAPAQAYTPLTSHCETPPTLPRYARPQVGSVTSKLVVFHTPPPEVATYTVFAVRGSTRIAVTRPLSIPV